jgi:phage FluMu protein Com
MEGLVVRVLPLVWNDYFKCFQSRFRVKCPQCGVVNKHGEGFDEYPTKRIVKGFRGCDKCRKEYSFTLTFE